MADGVRFELTEGQTLDGFQDRCIQPLCHPSAGTRCIIHEFFHNGREILTDNEGFLKNKEDWSVELMEYMAKQDNLTLTLEHKLVIETVQHYYEEYATTPPIRGLITLLKKTRSS